MSHNLKLIGNRYSLPVHSEFWSQTEGKYHQSRSNRRQLSSFFHNTLIAMGVNAF